MNCKECEARLSEYIDGALAPDIVTPVSNHLSACVSCSGVLDGLRRSLQLLRGAGREEPPPGLEAAILESLDALPRPAIARRDARRPLRRALLAAAAAAAVILLWIGADAMFRERARSIELAGRVASAEEELSTLRREWGAERAHLLAEIERVGERAEAGRVEAASATVTLAAERRTREGIEEKVELLESALSARGEQIAELEVRLAACGAEAERLARAPDVARPHPASAPPAVAQRVGPPPQKRAPSASRSDPIVIRREAGMLELEVSGPRREVVPRLIEMARQGFDPEVSSLALSSLEDLMGPARRPASSREEDRAGVKQWFERRVSGLSSMTPPIFASSLDGGEAAETEASARLRRLDELERMWEEDLATGAKSARNVRGRNDSR